MDRWLVAASVPFAFAGAMVEHFHPELRSVADTLAVGAVAVATLGGGWIGGVIALIVSPLLLLSEPAAHLLGEWVEWVVVVTVMLVARRSLLRLQRSESKLRALLSSIDDLIVVLDERGTNLEISATNRALMYRPDTPDREKIGRTVHDIFPKETADWIVETVRRVLSEQRTIEVDYSLPIGGSTVWLSAAVSPLSESRVIWVARDITARKLAEQVVQRSNEELEERVKEHTRELRSSEERYRSVFDQAQEVIFSISREGFLTSLNPAFERILGWRVSEWIGKHFTSLVPADAQPEAADLFNKLLSDGKIDLTRFVVVAKNGDRMAFEVSVVEQILQDKGVGFLGVARDVTEREQAAEALRRNERQLAEAQAVAKVGSWEHDLKTGTLWWSDEAYRAFALQPRGGPMSFEEFVEIIRPGDRQLVADFRSALYLKGEHSADVELLTTTGEKRIFTCRARLMRDEQGVARRVIGTTQDVTEQKRSEQMLRESEERFRLLARATLNAVWDLDLLTGKVWRGDGYDTLFGYASGEIRLSSAGWHDLVHPDDLSRVDNSLREAIESGQTSWSCEYRLRRADGSYATVLDRALIVRDEQKRPTRMLGAIMDLTERKLMEDQLEQAKRVSGLGRVAASIAHEFNNVLMGIQPNVEVIQRSSPRGLRTVTSNILHAVQRGKRITDEILRFTRPVEPNLQCLSVEEFFEQWKSEVEPLLGANIDLRFDTGSDVYVLADSLQLAQVFTNLALNARDAMRDRPGTLTVAAHLSKSFGSFPFGVVKSPDRFIHFRVTDEGCGIEEERLAHIFEPLFTTKKGGIGLGLAIAYQIITRHNGHIFVESEPGKGSTFHLFIPATLPAIQESAAKGAPAQLSLRRVLLVEDEPSVASGMAMLLETEGISVTIASTGREAIPAIESFLPDVVVLDIGLPDMDGVGVYQEIDRRWPALPVLFSSGHGDSAKLEKYLARPHVGFILKPYEFETMRRELNRLLDSRVARAR